MILWKSQILSIRQVSIMIQEFFMVVLSHFWLDRIKGRGTRR